MRTLLRRAATTALLLVAPAVAAAQSITYRFSGLGTGSYGGTAFVAAPFVVSIVQPNASAPYADRDPAIPSFAGLSGTLTIGGVVTGAVIDQRLLVFNNRTAEVIGFSSLLTFYDVLNIGAPGAGLPAYGLRTPFGPITGSASAFDHFATDVTVDGQVVSFAAIPTATFEAISGVATVPEPTTVALLGAGLAGVVLVARRRPPGLPNAPARVGGRGAGNAVA